MPQLINPNSLPTEPDERLTAYETAIEASRSALAGTISKARFRAEVEIGFALAAIRSEELHLRRAATIEQYGAERWGYKRSTLYELMDTAEIRLAAAVGVVSGNPDTKRHKAITTPAPRPALEASPPPALRPAGIELSKSAALEVVPVWREEGTEAALALVAEAERKANEKGGRLTAALVREVVKDRTAEDSQGTDAGTLPPSEEARRRAVNDGLKSLTESLERSLIKLGKLRTDGVPPLDAEDAARQLKAIRTVGKALSKAQGPEGT
ncbi:hypothetical protein [Streptomyces harbinensis]|uniref:hypothetical protein n=1 Tax=Streptomyces harbinensis TaxID=1176198 RepID=UPI000B8143BF|nr:hypothetical protein [Streptomyces harbinensis]